jgi:DUF1365 family protein
MRGEVIHTRITPAHHHFRAKVTVMQLPLVSMAAHQDTGNWAWGLDFPYDSGNVTQLLKNRFQF